MLQKVATVLFVVVQCAFIACALLVVSESETPTNIIDIATFLVAYYTLGSSARKIFDVYIASCRKSYSKKGDGSLTHSERA